MENKKAFVQHKGSEILDASALLMPIFLFIDVKNEKWIKTFEAIERELKVDVLIYRYRDDHNDVDGLDGGDHPLVCLNGEAQGRLGEPVDESMHGPRSYVM